MSSSLSRRTEIFSPTFALSSMPMLFNSLISKIGSDFNPGTSRNTKLSVTLFTTPVIIFPSSRLAVLVNCELSSCSNSFDAGFEDLYKFPLSF